MLCSICSKTIDGAIHNAMPIISDVCCSTCNVSVVIPFRVYGLGTNLKEALELDLRFKMRIIKPTATNTYREEVDNGIKATTNGYDAILVEENNYLVLVNRTKLILLDDNGEYNDNIDDLDI
jgi:hypothetical protein